MLPVLLLEANRELGRSRQLVNRFNAPKQNKKFTKTSATRVLNSTSSEKRISPNAFSNHLNQLNQSAKYSRIV